MNCEELYVRCNSDANIKINILISGSNLRALTKETYLDNQLKSTNNALLVEQRYSSQKTEEVSLIILSLADCKKGKLLPNEEINSLRQFGLIFSDNNGVLRILPPGEQLIIYSEPLYQLCPLSDTYSISTP